MKNISKVLLVIAGVAISSIGFAQAMHPHHNSHATHPHHHSHATHPHHHSHPSH